MKNIISFDEYIVNNNISIQRNKIDILQVNIGKICNQSCHHCHVEAGPLRKEIMDKNTIDRILYLLKQKNHIQTIDITGGAPELNPYFKYFIKGLKNLDKEIIDRCNLTVLLERGQENTPQFLAQNKVIITASLPCYLEENVDAQRGKNVFDKSIKALTILNNLGYGQNESDLILNLVYNPVDIHLPPSQEKLEADYKKFLQQNFNVQFNNLFTITNMPIKRFQHSLKRSGNLENYMNLLFDNFNSNAAKNVMCTNLISIGWDGKIYDCDFNQMLEIPLNWKEKNIFDINDFSEINKNIAFANHCYGCTAGNGSSCGGAIQT